jgi:uncharacterized LabA/DUF88 family protein
MPPGAAGRQISRKKLRVVEQFGGISLLACRLECNEHGPEAYGGDVSDPARTPRLAVLIDADNVPPRAAEGLFDEIARLGEASVRRIYGDFSEARLKGWAALLSGLAIIPQQQFGNTVGKNASDIALVIDAMDLLHTGRFDGFCLVSSDSDFTRLASRIREQGVDVYGFGEMKTPSSFRQACKKFIYIENLIENLQPAAVASKVAPSPAGPPNGPRTTALPLLRRALAQMEDEDGWVHLGRLGQQIAKLAPDFDSRTYGQKNLSGLIAATGAFETGKRAGGSYVRLKPSGKRAAGKAAASTSR